MKISIAQLRPYKGDVFSNIQSHIRLINKAVSNDADAIFFPELSITGYEPTLASELATNQDDVRFDVFQEISNSNKITIGIGMPLKDADGIKIGMIIFQPNSKRKTYSKQELHSDEFPFFVNGNTQTIIEIGHLKIAPAICYESLQVNHFNHAYNLGADLYLAMVAKSINGINKAELHFPVMATKFSMPILMCNFIGHCDNFDCFGKSAIWSKKGHLIAQLDDKTEGILIFDSEIEKAHIF